MTIYAIVNNLLPRPENTESHSPLWTVVSASSILQGGNPYFVPDFAQTFEARTALALRIGKLGKSIAPRFASRYVDAIAPAVVMVATDLLQTLQKKGLPWSAAISYDRSVAIGAFRQCPFEYIGESIITQSLLADGNYTSLQLPVATFGQSIEETVSAISCNNTLKTGDIILAGISESGPTMKPGQRMILTIDGQDSLKFNIR